MSVNFRCKWKLSQLLWNSISIWMLFEDCSNSITLHNQRMKSKRTFSIFNQTRDVCIEHLWFHQIFMTLELSLLHVMYVCGGNIFFFVFDDILEALKWLKIVWKIPTISIEDPQKSYKWWWKKKLLRHIEWHSDWSSMCWVLCLRVKSHRSKVSLWSIVNRQSSRLWKATNLSNIPPCANR